MVELPWAHSLHGVNYSICTTWIIGQGDMDQQIYWFKAKTSVARLCIHVDSRLPSYKYFSTAQATCLYGGNMFLWQQHHGRNCLHCPGKSTLQQCPQMSRHVMLSTGPHQVSELFSNYRLSTASLLKVCVSHVVCHKSWQLCGFYARNFGTGEKWQPAVIQEFTGPISVLVKTQDGSLVRHH